MLTRRAPPCRYGFDKESEFGTEPTNVVFYDLGSTSFKVKTKHRAEPSSLSHSQLARRPLPPAV